MQELKVLEEREILRVTDLKPIKKGYKVDFNDGSSIIVSEDIVLKYRLVKGKEVDIKVLKDLNSDERLAKCYNQALRYIGSSFKCSFQIKENLLKHEFSLMEIDYTINKLIENKILDDSLYLNEYINCQIRQGYGRKMIEFKAKALMLNVGNALNEIDYDLYYDSLKSITKRQLRLYKDNKIVKIKKYLLNRGYTIDEILEVLRGEELE